MQEEDESDLDCDLIVDSESDIESDAEPACAVVANEPIVAATKIAIVPPPQLPIAAAAAVLPPPLPPMLPPPVEGEKKKLGVGNLVDILKVRILSTTTIVNCHVVFKFLWHSRRRK